jgi:hypothetical protein
MPDAIGDGGLRKREDACPLVAQGAGVFLVFGNEVEGRSDRSDCSDEVDDIGEVPQWTHQDSDS